MKVDKYDRQIRLWGAKGQRKLGEAKIALLGCSGPGIEALKNMVLPGIGQIDIWDNEKLQLSDLCSSFFYEQTSIGNYKGQQAIKNLLQMNPDVKGEWHNKSVSQLLDCPQYLKKYDLCIACQFNDELNRRISEVCQVNHIPVIFGISFGFLFYVRNQKVHHFVESQPSQDGTYYMRLSTPFQQLKQYSNQWNIRQLLEKVQNNNQAQQSEIVKNLSKIPYPIILIQAFQSLPKQERKITNVKNVLSKWTQKVHIDHRANFRQAQTKYFDLFRQPEDFMLDFEIFNHPQVTQANGKSSLFCKFLKAASKYYEGKRVLPQPTRLPDMETSSVLYIQLKNAYKKQHAACKKQILKIMNQLFPSIAEVDEQLISFYIENINGLQIITMKSFHEELKQINKDNLQDQKDTYLALRIYQAYRTKKQKAPTMTDLKELSEFSKELCESQGVNQIDGRYIEEICRSEGKEFISISSMMGAIIGQEAVKLITNVFCPMMTGYAYNGIRCSGAQMCL